MNRLMIDIETLGTAPRGAVVAIGACVFDTNYADTPIGAKFEALVDVKSAKAIGEVHQSTMDWWATQDQEVYKAMTSGSMYIADALRQFAGWVKEQRVDEVWANGPTFDLAILREMYMRCGEKTPWHYRDERCVRTMYALGKSAGITIDEFYEGTVQHNALCDAVRQAMAITKIIRGLT